ncbi:MAG TPA: SBBP repeat-containing protein [Bacteroidota bacterium]
MFPRNYIPEGAYVKAMDQAKRLESPFSFYKTAVSGWQPIGPRSAIRNLSTDPAKTDTISGRMETVAIDPDNPQTVYIGAANGGVWKTTNGGTTWIAKTDTQKSLSSGALALDPCDYKTVYCGTGEAAYSADSYYGAGLLKSTDGGETWTRFTSVLPTNSYFSRIIAGSSRDTNPPVITWNDTYKGIGTDGGNAPVGISVDDSGNVIVAGTMYNGSSHGYDFMVVKYDSCGDKRWVRYFDGQGKDDFASAMVVSKFGDIYVTGKSWRAGNTCRDWLTVRCGPNGDSLGARRFSGTKCGGSATYPAGIALNRNGSVYVVGATEDTGHVDQQMSLVKYSYDLSTPDPLFRSYTDMHSLGPSPSATNAIVIDTTSSLTDNIFVANMDVDTNRQPHPTAYKIQRIDEGTFLPLWSKYYSDPTDTNTFTFSQPLDITTDTAGNVFVTGVVPFLVNPGDHNDHYGIATLSYTANGTQRWVARHNVPGDSSFGKVIRVSRTGAYVAGFTPGTGRFDASLIKYNLNTNDSIWRRTYNGPGNGNDNSTAMTLDDSGNVYVTGFSFGGATNFDYFTIKYKPNGDTAWVRRFDSNIGLARDVASAIAVKKGDVYVTGDAQSQYSTIRYGSRSRYVLAALGRSSHASDGSGGIYRSTNGGQSWTQSVSGRCDDIVASPTGDTIYAVGNGSNYQISYDGGKHFALGVGLTIRTRNQIAICKQAPAILYEAGYSDGTNTIGLYKSTDAGLTFTNISAGLSTINSNTENTKQGFYDFYLYVKPDNPNYVYIGLIDLWRSTDGGASFVNLTNAYGNGTVHPDQHNFAFNPANPNQIYIVNDGGVWYSPDAGNTWSTRNSPTFLSVTQFYSIGSPNVSSRQILGGAQDNGVLRTSNWGQTWGAPSGFNGGDGGITCFHPLNPRQFVTETQFDHIIYSKDGGANVTYGLAADESNSAFIAPIVANAGSAGVFYTGRRQVYKSTDAGVSWNQLSPSMASGNVIRVLAQSKPNSAIMYASTGADFYRSLSGGTSWSQLAVPWTFYVTSIRPHPDSAGVVFVTLSGFIGSDVVSGHVYRSSDTGTTWRLIDGTNLPNAPVNDMYVQPGSGGPYIVASDAGVFITTNGGGAWSALGSVLPHSPAISLDRNITALRVGTYGRGVWQLDGVFPAAPAPVAASPPNGATGWSPTGPFGWTPSGHLSRGVKRISSVSPVYNVALAADSLFDSTVYYQGGIADTFLAVPPGVLAYGTTYYWKVSTTDSTGDGEWSQPWSFTTIDSATGGPTWRLVSLPRKVADPRTRTLFPNSISRAFSYAGSYQVEDTLTPGKGYWVKFSDLNFPTIQGTTVSTETVSVVQRWNMIGSVSVAVPVDSLTSDPPGMVTSRFYGYVPGAGYDPGVTSIQPGQGYWVRVNQDGKIVISSGGSVAAEKIHIDPTITELPPPPPGLDAVSLGKGIPREFALMQSYPNPFNPSATIRYQLPAASRVTLRIYNALGQEIATLIDGTKEAGYYSETWNAGRVTSGIYFYRLHASGVADPGRTFMNVKKMALIK